MWRRIVGEMQAQDYSGIELNNFYVDNCAMQLVLNPGQFDVVLTNNIFGDILSDEASVIAGSIGMLLLQALVTAPVCMSLFTAVLLILQGRASLTPWELFIP